MSTRRTTITPVRRARAAARAARSAAVVGVTAALVVGTPLAAFAGPVNPFNGVNPSIPGGEFSATWVRVLGAIWGIAFAACALIAIRAGIQYGAAKKQGYEHGVTEAASDIRKAIGATGFMAALPVVFAAILLVV